ncbi:MAG: DNA-binding protein [Anaerolineaceae bacterium]|nr:DNA-binding protein [Anaerolineaceae bacterium]
MTTSSIVCDASLILSTVLNEPQTQKAKALLQTCEQSEVQLAAPYLFHYEIISVIRRNVYIGKITAEEGINIRDTILKMPIQLMSDDSLLKRAYELATQYNRPTAYDSQYLAVAERLNCEFWTADERLVNAVGNDLSWVRWVGNFSETG